MPETLSLRFHKPGKFSSILFIASSKRASEKHEYNTLAAWAAKLKQLQPNAYQPVFHNERHGYVSVQVKTFGYEALCSSLKKNDLCQLKLGISKVVKQDRVFYNPVMTSIKLVKKYQRPADDLLDTSSWCETKQDDDDEGSPDVSRWRGIAPESRPVSPESSVLPSLPELERSASVHPTMEQKMKALDELGIAAAK